MSMKILDEMFPEEEDKPEGISVEVEVEAPESEDDSGEEEDDFDPFDPASVKAYIAEQLAKLVQTAQASTTPPTSPEVQPPDTTMSRQEQLAKFKAEHPDVDQYREGIRMKMEEHGCSPEDAYAMCKQEEADRANRAKADTARSIRASGGGSATSIPELKKPSTGNTSRDIWDRAQDRLRSKRDNY